MPDVPDDNKNAAGTIAAVIVTHNSAPFMDRNLCRLIEQSRPLDKIVIVDSGSTDTSYLTKLSQHYPKLDLVLCDKNVGFCRGNNLGAARVMKSADYVVFLNPDAYLTPSFIAEAFSFMQRPENQKVAIAGGTLLGFDNSADQPSGLIDSTGIFCTWYGRWFDRSQGSPVAALPQAGSPETVPAICGALMFCRVKALASVLLRGDEVFDEHYFMYKEDIDLSLRLRRAGWTLSYLPQAQAYHCRGWLADRKKMSAAVKRRSAQNELQLCINHPSHHIVYALAKFLYVLGIEARQTED